MALLLPKGRLLARRKPVAVFGDFDFDHRDDIDLLFVGRDDLNDASFRHACQVLGPPTASRPCARTGHWALSHAQLSTRGEEGGREASEQNLVVSGGLSAVVALRHVLLAVELLALKLLLHHLLLGLIGVWSRMCSVSEHVLC